MIVRERDRANVAGAVVSGGTVTAAMVTVAVPALVASCTLRAVIVMLCAELAAAGAVNTPVELIAPALAVQVTACEGLFVPATTAENVVEPVAVPGDTVTPVTVEAAGEAAARVTVAVPVFVVSKVLRAVIVIVWIDDVLAGAVNTPALLIEPAEAVHVTV